MTLPIDLDIFCPEFIHHPCAKSVLGSGKPAAKSVKAADGHDHKH